MTGEPVQRPGWSLGKRPDYWRHKSGAAVFLRMGGTSPDYDRWRWHLEEGQPYLGECMTRDEAMDNVERVLMGGRCSFCDKPAREVAKLVERPGGPSICDECVTLSMMEMAKSGWVPPTLTLNVEVDGRMVMTGAMRDRVDAWFRGGDTGVSSEAIWSAMTGFPVKVHANSFGTLPADPSDFGRCYRLLKAFPEWEPIWRERMVAQFPIWEKLVANWDELTSLYLKEVTSPQPLPKLYDRMKELSR